MHITITAYGLTVTGQGGWKILDQAKRDRDLSYYMLVGWMDHAVEGADLHGIQIKNKLDRLPQRNEL